MYIPYPSWERDENGVPQPPIPYPDEDEYYLWDEDSVTWVPGPSGDE